MISAGGRQPASRTTTRNGTGTAAIWRLALVMPGTRRFPHPFHAIRASALRCAAAVACAAATAPLAPTSNTPHTPATTNATTTRQRKRSAKNAKPAQPPVCRYPRVMAPVTAPHATPPTTEFGPGLPPRTSPSRGSKSETGTRATTRERRRDGWSVSGPRLLRPSETVGPLSPPVRGDLRPNTNPRALQAAARSVVALAAATARVPQTRHSGPGCRAGPGSGSRREVCAVRVAVIARDCN
jgi:hypothetical protein